MFCILRSQIIIKWQKKTNLLLPTETHLVISLLQTLSLLLVPNHLLLNPRLDDVTLLQTLVAVFNQVALRFDRPQVTGQLVGEFDFKLLKVEEKKCALSLRSEFQILTVYSTGSLTVLYLFVQFRELY